MKIARSLLSFVYTLVIYIGLPLLGWGLDDLPGFLAFPQLTGYSASIIVFGLLAGYLIQRPGGMGNTLGKGRTDTFVPRQRAVRLLITGMLFGALVFVPFADRRDIGVMNDWAWLRWAGMLLAILGMGLIFWSGIALGRLYSPEVTLQKEHRLITDGPYRLIRHPRYLGGIVQGFGLSLLFRSWVGILLTFVFILVVIFRIRDEESMLRAEFGAQWEAYCDKAWRLMPLIY